MRPFNQIITLFAFATLVLPAQADIDTSSLIKVEKGKNTQCAEYYNYKGELYCSTTAQRLKDTPQDYASLEKQTLVFDERPWYAAWGQKTDAITTIEYIPKGEKIDQWQELVTSQFIPGLQDKISPKVFSENVIKYLKDSGLDPKINMISEEPNRVMFEFQVLEPENLKQHELQLITKGTDGIYVLHYVIKKAPMDKALREKWIKILNESKTP